MGEVFEQVKDEEGKEILVKYLKKFNKASKEEAKKIREGMVELNNPKVKEYHIAKVIDFLPDTSEEINKIFIDSNLNEEETNKIIEIVKKA